MIQDYLKTGMVFYRDSDEQHFRSDCCKETFCQFTDKTHFPSFQFYSDMFVDKNSGFDVYDLEDNLIGSFGIANMNFYHHAGGGVTVSHDFRDAVTYPVQIKYDECYYLKTRVYDIAGAMYQYYYSEAFKVCDCDVIATGDGENLITNGWFEDWSGVADPNNVPDGWSVANNDATNYVHDSSTECQLISSAPLAGIYIRQTPLTIGKWYVFTFNITAITGSIRIRSGGVGLASYNTTGNKNLVFQAINTEIHIREFGACNATFTNVRVEDFVGFAFCDMITLNWWSDCDWDRIIYQDGFRNSLVLDSSLQTPSEDIVINPDERQGEMFVHDVVIKKRYKFNIRIPEYLWNALIRLPAYGSEMPNFHAWFTLPIYDYEVRVGTDPADTIILDALNCSMSEVAILGEWDVGNCMNTFTIEFIDNDEYPVVATNCCDDEDISEV